MAIDPIGRFIFSFDADNENPITVIDKHTVRRT